MKRTINIFILFLIFSLSCGNSINKTVSKLTKEEKCNFLVENPETYIGKNIEDLILNLKKDYKNLSYSHDPPGKIQALNLSYGKLYMLVYLKYPLDNMASVDMDLNWDLDLVKKEKIRKIEIMSSLDLLCEVPGSP